MNSIHLARNLVFHAWTKHIEVHYHFIREHVLVGDVYLQHIRTNLQTTDIITKALGVHNEPQSFDRQPTKLEGKQGVDVNRSPEAEVISPEPTIQRLEVVFEGAC